MLSQYKLPNLLADFNYVFDGICSGADLDQKREERDKKQLLKGMDIGIYVTANWSIFCSSEHRFCLLGGNNGSHSDNVLISYYLFMTSSLFLLDFRNLK